ncbi:CMD domain protein [Frondihabitans cladoniiphilus]|uniref:CMD domain protein n=1 Tax=Frondihabitans cladoniiphilus TaxID=715785 RepID=A0ABP8VLP2_9MICO
MSHADVIDHLAGIEPGTPLDAVRSARPEARSQAQASFDALFTPLDAGTFDLVERWAVATVVTAFHGEPSAGAAAFYHQQLVESGAAPSLVDAVTAAAQAGVTEGPYGSFPAGPLSGEDTHGLHLAIDEPLRSRLGERLAAAVEHVHLLVFRPRDSSSEALTRLEDAGWSVDDIVTLSQEVAFLTFQVRVVAGLGTLLATPAAADLSGSIR